MLKFTALLSIFSISMSRFGYSMLALAAIYPACYLAMKEITGTDPYGLLVVIMGVFPFLVFASPFALYVSFKNSAARFITPILAVAIIFALNSAGRLML
jgi:hypothetical protein